MVADIEEVEQIDASEIYAKRLNAKKVSTLKGGEKYIPNRGSSSTPLRDSSWYHGEGRNDFWFISGDFIYRHHVEPRVKLYVPREEFH